MFDFASLGLGKVDTLVDVGAGVGAFLGPALEYCQPSKYLAIEMLPERASYLEHRFGHAHVTRCAVGESSGRATMFRTVSQDSSSLLIVNPESQRWYDVIPHGFDQYASEFDEDAYIMPLDTLVPKDWQVDLMKMDVQGYEGRAIRGGKDTLRRTRALIIEVLFCQHYEGQSSRDEINMLLIGLGFRFDRWLSEDWNRDHTLLLQGDAFYVNTRF